MTTRVGRWGIRVFAGVLLAAISACGGGGSRKPPVVAAIPPQDPRHIEQRQEILSFEEVNPPVEWRSGSASVHPPAATMPALERSSIRPRQGLWSLKIPLDPDSPGEIVHPFAHPTDLQKFDFLSAAVMHLDPIPRSGEWQARLFLVDADDKRIDGDPLPVTTQWQDLLLDLQTASDEGADVSQIVEIGIAFQNVRPGHGVLDVQTDDWAGERRYRAYQGQRLGRDKTFYVENQGMRLRVGMAGGYEIVFHQRSGLDRPWMTVSDDGGKTMALGQPGTGLMLLGQDAYDNLGEGVRRDAFSLAGGAAGTMPRFGWPIHAAEEAGADQQKQNTLKREFRRDGAAAREDGGESQWRWECVWTSPVAAIVEVKQEVGPYDRLGEPAARLTWRFMIYQWGQVFVHVDWAAGSGAAGAAIGRPVTWALITDENDNLPLSDKNEERLLQAIYPVSVRSGLQTVLPHQMQTGAAIAMIAKADVNTAEAKDVWWWARGGGRRIFGAGLSTLRAASSADCMLLVNSPNALMQASTFGAYLVPPKVKVRQGELDRNFPGDVDNDGFVDSYGFQVIRFSGGRASFVIYPQERPLFYPAYLFTVPAIERDADDLKHSRVLINLDGQQFADPPQFPDGSFLLQLPYTIDKPVSVEAILVKK